MSTNAPSGQGTPDRSTNDVRASGFTVDLSAAGPCMQVAAVGGAVGLYEARALERGVLEGIRRGRTRVVLDLGDVTDVGPGLLGVLLRIRRGVTRVDGRLAMVVASPPVAALVRTTVLTALIDIAEDRETALALVSAAAAGGRGRDARRVVERPR